MRSIFDQYDSPENRLTHALGCCLERDRRLLRRFIRWAAGGQPPAGRIEVLEQQVPRTLVGLTDEDESAGLPDLWIHNGARWSLLIESKVAAAVSADQLHRHRNTAHRNEFTDLTLVVLAPIVPPHRVRGVVYRTWPQVYSWLRRQAKRSEWAACMAEYMEIAEARMTANDYIGDRPLTEFDGIPFGTDHPYTYREAKRVLKLALDELRKRHDLQQLGMDPKGLGRPRIKGRDGVSIWNFLWLKGAKGKGSHTTYPHLDLVIQAQRIIIEVTLPNAVPAWMRKNLTCHKNGFTTLVGQVEKQISRVISHIDNAHSIMDIHQRHCMSQNAAAIEDAIIEFDLRTATRSPKGKVKSQPQWLNAVFEALGTKKSNLIVSIGAAMPYGAPQLHSRKVLDVIAGVWLACEPWLNTILGRRS